MKQIATSARHYRGSCAECPSLGIPHFCFCTLRYCPSIFAINIIDTQLYQCGTTRTQANVSLRERVIRPAARPPLSFGLDNRLRHHNAHLGQYCSVLTELSKRRASSHEECQSSCPIPIRLMILMSAFIASVRELEYLCRSKRRFPRANSYVP